MRTDSEDRVRKRHRQETQARDTGKLFGKRARLRQRKTKEHKLRIHNESEVFGLT